jgi:hypothetical protein
MDQGLVNQLELIKILVHFRDSLPANAGISVIRFNERKGNRKNEKKGMHRTDG